MRFRETLILLALVAALFGASVVTHGQVVRTPVESTTLVQEPENTPDAGGSGSIAPPTTATMTYTYTDILGGIQVVVTPQTGGESTPAWVKRHIDAIKLIQDAFPPKQQQ